MNGIKMIHNHTVENQEREKTKKKVEKQKPIQSSEFYLRSTEMNKAQTKK